MLYLTHADPNVRYEVLIAVQKMMVHNWSVSVFSGQHHVHAQRCFVIATVLVSDTHRAGE